MSLGLLDEKQECYICTVLSPPPLSSRILNVITKLRELKMDVKPDLLFYCKPVLYTQKMKLNQLSLCSFFLLLSGFFPTFLNRGFFKERPLFPFFSCSGLIHFLSLFGATFEFPKLIIFLLLLLLLFCSNDFLQKTNTGCFEMVFPQRAEKTSINFLH